ncbi:HalD/BesD family halogenase [Streptomyces griseofuscus]|uniref:HalD/BesD family halogenase n=1 Tax=Streptomyces griseofuscus TaxID=146922 RepID=UPI003453AC6F
MKAESSALRVTASEVNGLLARHFAEEFDQDRMEALRRQFEDEHIVPLRQLCPPELFGPIKDEACAIMDRHGVSHDLVFEITDNTPRSMTTVGQPVIKDEGPLIDAFYFAPELIEFVGRVVGEKVHSCPYAGEHYVISRLVKSGDTHGWHWDDFTYGIILVLEAPHYTDGGFVQAVPNTAWDKENPDVYGALLSSQVRSYALEPGDAYVVKTNTTMHRVHPIRGEGRRTIVNMTLASAEDLTKPMTHETNDALFGGVRDTRSAS